MSTSVDFANALQRGDNAAAERHLTDMDADELEKVADAFTQAGQHSLAKDLHEHVVLRRLGEKGMRIRMPFR